jgi:hypothetical protein
MSCVGLGGPQHLAIVFARGVASRWLRTIFGTRGGSVIASYSRKTKSKLPRSNLTSNILKSLYSRQRLDVGSHLVKLSDLSLSSPFPPLPTLFTPCLDDSKSNPHPAPISSPLVLPSSSCRLRVFDLFSLVFEVFLSSFTVLDKFSGLFGNWVGIWLLSPG